MSLSIFIFLFANYKYFSTDNYYNFFYLKFIITFFIFTFILFILRLFFNRGILIYFCIITFSIFISLIIIEFFFTFNSKSIINSIEIRANQAKKLGLTFDKRSKYEFYIDTLKSGVKAVPSIPPNDFFVNYKEFKSKDSLYALSGASNLQTIFCNEGGERIIYRSDRYGFRNKDETWNNEMVDFVLLGDSLAQGACVNDSYTIHERIIFYSGKKLINLGYQGHGPLMQLGALKEYAKNKKPKKIIWLYYETNDIDNLVYEHQWDIFKSYLYNENFTQNLIKKQNILDNDHIKMVKRIYANKQIGDRVKKKEKIVTFSILQKSIVKLYHLREFISFFIPRKYSLTLQYYSPIDAFEIYSQILDEAIKTADDWGGKIYFVYYPHSARYFDSLVYPYPLRKYDFMLDLVNKKIKNY